MTTRNPFQQRADDTASDITATPAEEVCGFGGLPGGVFASRLFSAALNPTTMAPTGEEIPQLGRPPYTTGGSNSGPRSPR